LKTPHGVKPIELAEWRAHGKGFVAQVVGIDDRNAAELLCPVDIAVEKDLLADLDDGEFYWHQLEGLRVISQFLGQTYDFGKVKKILPTGANDVLVVVGDEQSIDQGERLIPYVPGQFITNINIAEGVIDIEWDPEF
jgi:16S rRNA processing protein RimM